MTGSYTADIIDVPSHGIRLRPEHGADVPRAPSEQNLLALAIAMALGAGSPSTTPSRATPGCRRSTPCSRATPRRRGGQFGRTATGPPPALRTRWCARRSKSAAWSCPGRRGPLSAAALAAAGADAAHRDGDARLSPLTPGRHSQSTAFATSSGRTNLCCGFRLVRTARASSSVLPVFATMLTTASRRYRSRYSLGKPHSP